MFSKHFVVYLTMLTIPQDYSVDSRVTDEVLSVMDFEGSGCDLRCYSYLCLPRWTEGKHKKNPLIRILSVKLIDEPSTSKQVLTITAANSLLNFKVSISIR
jgi:hypothetical protein